MLHQQQSLDELARPMEKDSREAKQAQLNANDEIEALKRELEELGMNPRPTSGNEVEANKLELARKENEFGHLCGTIEYLGTEISDSAQTKQTLELTNADLVSQFRYCKLSLWL